MESTVRRLQMEKQRAVDETKRKQWCAMCGKEAIFYCCWNTSYCDYPCQQLHWEKHMETCTQAKQDQQQSVPSTPTTTEGNSSQQHRIPEEEEDMSEIPVQSPMAVAEEEMELPSTVEEDQLKPTSPEADDEQQQPVRVASPIKPPPQQHHDDSDNDEMVIDEESFSKANTSSSNSADLTSTPGKSPLPGYATSSIPTSSSNEFISDIISKAQQKDIPSAAPVPIVTSDAETSKTASIGSDSQPSQSNTHTSEVTPAAELSNSDAAAAVTDSEIKSS